VTSSNLSDNGAGVKSGTVTAKVPLDRFDETMGKIKSIARVVLNESTSGQDVTSQYVDLQAQLKNKQTEEQAFADILSRSTQKVSDVLEVTRELARVRGEIERLQAQMKYLESQTDMATISVFLSEDQRVGKVDNSWRPWQVVKDAVNALIKNLQWLANFLISLVIVVLPILLILFLIFGLILWKLGKKAYEWLKKR
jgi:predicted ATP-grasp superfamily ATP-dependent carboligase